MPHILIADDDPAVRGVLADALMLAGHTVDRVCNGLQALSVFSRQRPEAMVLDLAMPCMNVQTVMSTLRNQNALGAVPFVAISGQSEPEEIEVRIGAKACQRKPLDLPQVLECVRQIAE